MNYLEIYYRDKGSSNWNTAKGIYEYRIEHDELLDDLACANRSLEFDSNYFWLKVDRVEELGRYELSPLLADEKIKKKFGFQNRDDLGWKGLEELTEEVYIPKEKVVVIEREDLPF